MYFKEFNHGIFPGYMWNIDVIIPTFKFNTDDTLIFNFILVLEKEDTTIKPKTKIKLSEFAFFKSSLISKVSRILD